MREKLSASGGNFVVGGTAQNNYDAIQLACPAGTTPFAVTSNADLDEAAAYIADLGDGRMYYMNLVANNADAGFIQEDGTYKSASIPSAGSVINGNGNSGCGGSAAYPNYDPIPVKAGGLFVPGGRNYLYITCESAESAPVLCTRAGEATGELVTGGTVENSVSSINDNAKCPAGTTVFAVKSRADFDKLQNWVFDQPGGGFYYANFYAKATDAGYYDATTTYHTAGIGSDMLGVIKGNGDGCSTLDPIPLQAGQGMVSRSGGNYLYEKCEQLLTASVVCHNAAGAGTAGTGGVLQILVDGSNVIADADENAAGLHLARVNPVTGAVEGTMLASLAAADDATADVAAFVTAAAAGTIVAGALGVSADMVIPAGVTTALKDIGVSAPILHSDMGGWSFIGRKGAPVASVPAVISHDMGTPATVDTGFACPSLVATVPDNDVEPLVPVFRRPMTAGGAKLQVLGTPQTARFVAASDGLGVALAAPGSLDGIDQPSASLQLRLVAGYYRSAPLDATAQQDAASVLTVSHAQPGGHGGWWLTQSTTAGFADNSVAALTDDNQGTGAATLATATKGSWVVASFAEPVAVSDVTLAALSAVGPAGLNGAVIEHSSDLAVWTLLQEVTGVAASGETVISFVPVVTRHLRLRVGTGAALALGTLRIAATGVRQPHELRVQCRLRPVGGANAGFSFVGATGTSQRGDAAAGNKYGGVVCGWDATTVTAWLPSKSQAHPNPQKGNVISVGTGGWGEDNAAQTDVNGELEVTVTRARSADFDSGWLSMTQGDSSASTYQSVSHTLGLPDRVTVLVQATSGPLEGKTFYAAGSAQTNGGAGGEWGGLVFGYSETEVRVWGPAANPGHLLYVGSGWGASTTSLAADAVSFRVLAWRAGRTPDFDDTVAMAANTPGSTYKQVVHGLDAVPAVAEITVVPSGGFAAGFHFPALGMAQASGGVAADTYGGIVAAVSDNIVRLWAPSADSSAAGATLGHLVYLGSNWGASAGDNVAADTGNVRVRLWRHEMPIGDSATLELSVPHVTLPPTAKSVAAVEQEENIGNPIQVTALKGQPTDTLEFRVALGNPEGKDAIWEVDESSGQLRLVDPASINFVTEPEVRCVVEARSGLLADVAMVSLAVTGANNPPEITGGLAHEVPEGSPAGTVVGTVTASDPDDTDSVIFSIIGGNPGPTFRIGACDGVIRVAEDGVLDIQTKASYSLIVEVQDDAKRPKNDTAVVTITLLDVNDAPECTGPATVTVSEHAAPGANVGAALTATDPENDVLTWTIFSGDTDIFDMDGASGQLSLQPGAQLDFETKPTYSLVVRVADDDTPPLDALCAVTVQLTDANDAPSLVTTRLQVPEHTEPGAIVGVLLTHDDDAADTVTVALNEPSTAFAVSSDGTVTLLAGVSLDYERASSYELNVSVTDSAGAWAWGIVDVEIVDVNDPPAVVDTAFVVGERAEPGAVLGTVTAWDQDGGDTLTLSLTAGMGDPAVFTINGATGEMRLAGDAALDFETVPSYNVTVRATDEAGAWGEGYVTVTVTDENDPPTLTPASCDSTATWWKPLVGYSVISGVVTTPGSVGPDSGAYFFASATSATECEAACVAVAGLEGNAVCAGWTWFEDFYPLPAFRSQCYGRDVADSAVEESFAATSVVSGVEVHLCQEVVLSEDVTIEALVGSVLEAQDEDAGDSLSWSVSGGDPHSWFKVNTVTATSGQTVTEAALDADLADGTNFYVEVSAEDSAGDSVTATIAVSLTDVDEAPIMAATLTASVPVGAPPAEPVGGPLQPQDPEGSAVTCVLAAPSAGVDGSSVFAVSNAGQVAVGGTEITASSGTVYAFKVQCTDATAHTATADATVTVVEGNLSPVVDAGQTLSVPENSPVTTAASPAVTAHDRDTPPDALTFSLEAAGTTAADAAALNHFQIDPTTGVVSVRQAGLDTEITPSYTLSVVATDARGLRGSALVTVDVTNVNELPSCPSTSGSVLENEDPGVRVTPRVQCSDPESASLTFTVIGDQAPYFAVNATGSSFNLVVAPAGAPPIDHEAASLVTVKVQVEDGDGGSVTLDILVAVGDVNEVQRG